MKVIITKSGLPVPIGTIMDVGASIPRGWEGKCAPYIAKTAPIKRDWDPIPDEPVKKWRKRNG